MKHLFEVTKVGRRERLQGTLEELHQEAEILYEETTPETLIVKFYAEWHRTTHKPFPLIGEQIQH